MIYRSSEEAANKFNLRCILVLLFVSVASELFNEFGLFQLPKDIMRVSITVVIMIFAVPLFAFLINDKILGKNQSVLTLDWFKWLILVSVFVGIGVMCMIYTFHTVILLSVPALMVAQYYDQHKLFWWAFAVTLLLVPIGVYGGFFFGMPDRNFIKDALSADEFSSLANRISIATPERMGQLFLHYVIPRWLCIIIVTVLAKGIINRTGRMLASQVELTNRINDEMERRSAVQNHVIEALATLIETRDENTGGHVLRTRKYVSMIAHAMRDDPKFKERMTDEEIEYIENASPLHDVGKIAVSDTILLKPGKLTDEEFEKMKIHTTKGKSMILNLFNKMDDPIFMKTAEDIAVAHHEKWDGSGYPYGLKGEEIPLSARIMAVADVYDALVSDRVYKKAIPPEKALEVIYSESGTHFDPDIIRIVKGIEGELIEAANSSAGSE